jgi:hypothetical protein
MEWADRSRTHAFAFTCSIGSRMAGGTIGANWRGSTREDRLYRVLLSFGIAGLITTFVVLVLLLVY